MNITPQYSVSRVLVVDGVTGAPVTFSSATDVTVGTAHLSTDGMWSLDLPAYGDQHPSRRPGILPPFAMTHREMIATANALRLRRLQRQ